MLVLSLPAFGNKKYTAYDRFHGNGPYGKIRLRKNQSERSDLPCHIIKLNNVTTCGKSREITTEQEMVLNSEQIR